MNHIDVSDLEPDAREVVELVVQRLRMGRSLYGMLDLDRQRRDWSREADEELADLMVYLAARDIKRRRGL